eukprot:1092_1
MVYAWGCFGNSDRQSLSFTRDTQGITLSCSSNLEQSILCVGGVLNNLTISSNKHMDRFEDHPAKRSKTEHHSESNESLSLTKCSVFTSKVVTDVSCGRAHTLVLVVENSRTRAWAYGWNKFGQLGLGHRKSVESPCPITSLADNSISSVLEIAAGDRHSIFLCDSSDGERTVYACGQSSLCGVDNQQSSQCVDGCLTKPVALESSQFIGRVKRVACSWQHSLAITDRGLLYTWGCGLHGALGHGDIADRPRPDLTTLLEGMQVVDGDCGVWHSAVVTALGAVYTFGFNKHGQLGLTSLDDSSDPPANSLLPEMVDFPEDKGCDTRAVRVRCGARHTVALSKDGRVYAWGWNGVGQVQTDSKVECIFVPTLVPNILNISQIEAGHWNSFAWRRTE